MSPLSTMLRNCLGVCLRGGLRVGRQSLQFAETTVSSTSARMPLARICALDRRCLNWDGGFSSPHF